MTERIAYTLVSADSHVLEPPNLFDTHMSGGLRTRAPKLASHDGGSAWMVDGIGPVPLPATAGSGSGYRLTAPEGALVAFDDVLPGLYDPAERLKAQDADSVDAEILYPSPGLWDAIKQLEDGELKLACARAYNDWISDFSAHNPNRLIGLGKIPATTCDEARDELLRCVNELGLRGVMLDAWPNGSGTAGDPGDDPFWEAANELGVPVSLHYAVDIAKTTAPPGGIAPGLKPPMADAALPLVAAGVFDRFPNVRLVFAHGDAGWAFHWLEFMDINYVRHRHLDEYALQNADALPSEYIRTHSWFTFHHDRSAVKNRSKLGDGHLLWGSHFPLDDANWPDDRQQAMRVTEELPAEDRQALLAGNTARLYRLPGYEEGLDVAGRETLEPLVHF